MRTKKHDASVQNDRELLSHIQDLGLDSIEAYRLWCAENGFGKRLNKHWKQLARERYFAREAAAKSRLKTKKQETRKPLATITAICKGQIKEDDVTQPHLARFCQAIQAHAGPKRERRRNIESLLQLINHLHDCRAKLFDGSPVFPERGALSGNTYLEASVLVSTHCRSWLRPVESWKPSTKNARRQFGSLLRHLFARYDDVPRFFDGVWFADWYGVGATQRKWYLHVGRGESIRTCKLPIPFTKRMAHHFMRGPGDLTVTQALRWGQIHALGGNEGLVRALFGTRLGESFEQEGFWLTVIKWFIEHPMLDRSHVGPIIDYLHHQRFVPEQTFVGPGVREVSSPPQPNLSMRGRTPETLLRQVHQWHGRLANNNIHQICQWQPCGIEEFEFVEGSRESKNMRAWTIRELLGSKALVAEGRKLKHCVASYASSCARGHCSIWTMEIESYDGVTKALTIEIRNNTRTICQARGKLNRLPTDQERGIMRRWAAKSGLKIAGYV